MALSSTEALEVERIVKRMLANASVAVAALQEGAIQSDGYRTLNFQGAGVEVANDPSNRRANIIIPGAPTATTTSTFISGAGNEKTFPMGSLPANWYTTGFSDSGWSNSVAESVSISSFFVVAPTAAWITDTTMNGDQGATSKQFLARRHFTLPSGTISAATLDINVDDVFRGTTTGDALYVNGNAIQPPPPPSGTPVNYTTIDIPIGWLVTGSNVLAVGIYSGGGEVALSYRLTVSYTSAGADARYQLLSEKDQHSGYAGLNSSGLVTLGELGTGSPSGSNFLRGDGTWAAASTNSLTIEEVDGSPSVSATTLQLPNGSLSNIGGGVVRYTPPATGSYVLLRDEKTSGTNGGTFTSGAWRTRTLAEIIDADGVCSVSSNQFTLSAGTYRIKASAPAYAVNNHITRLQNVTDGSTIAVGSSEYASTNGAAATRSLLEYVFTIGASKALELQHICQTTAATNGFGVAAGAASTIEVYTVVELFRIG